MTELIIFVLIAGAVGYYAGWKARERHAQRRISQFQNYLEEVAKEAEKRIVEVRIERHGDKFFVYNAESGEFLAQGTTHKEITKTLNERFPGKSFTADKDNMREVEYKHDSV